MARRTLAAVIGALGAVSLLLAGCSGSGVNAETLDPPASTVTTSPLTPGPAATSTSSAGPSVEPSVGTSRATVGSSGAGASPTAAASTEGTDRAAVQAQWIKSWDVYLEIARTPAAERKALVKTVAVDPARANMLKDAGKFDAQGLETYGELGHRISWPQPIAGRDYAVIDDCQDASRSGSVMTATGDKVTVGVARDHYQGRLVKGEDGVWRVEQVFYLKDEPC